MRSSLCPVRRNSLQQGNGTARTRLGSTPSVPYGLWRRCRCQEVAMSTFARAAALAAVILLIALGMPVTMAQADESTIPATGTFTITSTPTAQELAPNGDTLITVSQAEV